MVRKPPHVGVKARKFVLERFLLLYWMTLSRFERDAIQSSLLGGGMAMAATRGWQPHITSQDFAVFSVFRGRHQRCIAHTSQEVPWRT